MSFIKEKEIGRGTYGVIHAGSIEYSDGKKERGASKQIFRNYNICGISNVLREIQILQTCSSKCSYFPKILRVFFEDYTRKSLDENVLKHESVTFVTELLEYNGSKVFGIHNYDINDIIDMSSQLICGIAFMHSRVITHRDLKPSNILVSFNHETGKPLLKICDFGFSQYLINSSNSTPGTNSPWYRAVEICWGNPKYGAASDVWAVGTVIYEMLSGKIFTKSKKIDDQNLFYEILSKNPNQWTENIHNFYLKHSNRPIKINGSLNPTTLQPGEPLINRFKRSKYFNKKDIHIWKKFEDLLKKCFEYNYKKRISCWELLSNSVFDSVREQIEITVDEIKKPRFNEIIKISLTEEVNNRKILFYQNFMEKCKKFPLRQLFHSVDLTNKILIHEEFTVESENVEKVCASCIYFFHKFFSTLSYPESMNHFFNDIETISNNEEYYILDEWIHNFELKMIRYIFPDFKIYKSGIFEMPDDYGMVLSNSDIKILFDNFLRISNWDSNTYRSMYRQLYNTNIDPNFEFKLNYSI